MILSGTDCNGLGLIMIVGLKNKKTSRLQNFNIIYSLTIMHNENKSKLKSKIKRNTN